MKIHVLGVKEMKGTAKESGNQFDMGAIFVIVPVENVSSAKFSVKGYGFEPGEMPLDPSALEQFSSFKYPCTLDLILEPSLYKGKISQIVTGTATQPIVKSVANG